jgi:hypothetical protein
MTKTSVSHSGHAVDLIPEPFTPGTSHWLAVAAVSRADEPFARDLWFVSGRCGRVGASPPKATHNRIKPMKTTLKSNPFAGLLRGAMIIVAAAVIPGVMLAKPHSNPADTAAALLARKGVVPVDAAGPYVERGTFRIQVSVTLGRPTAKLGEDMWLYEGRSIEGSGAVGTLVVRFKDGRVSELALVTPAVVASLRSNPTKAIGLPSFATSP